MRSLFLFGLIFTITGCATFGVNDPQLKLKVEPDPAVRGKKALFVLNAPMDADKVTGVLEIFTSPTLEFKKPEKEILVHLEQNSRNAPVPPGTYWVRLSYSESDTPLQEDATATEEKAGVVSPAIKRKPAARSISKATVFESIKEDHVVVLSVLPEAEFQKLHILGSRNLPLTQDQGLFAQAVEKQYGKKRFFILYGSNITSRSAIDASEALQRRGFKAEVYLSGMKDWKEAGFPIEGTDAVKKAVSP